MPAPDDLPSFPEKNFSFTRLGVRIPTLLISPWIARGTVISEPTDAEKPTDTSEFDLTSIISSVRNLLDGGRVPPLTKRDAWAATFDDYLTTLTEPRTDCPTTLPPAPKSLGVESATIEAAQRLNDLQTDIVGAYEALRLRTGVASPGALPQRQGEASEWISSIVQGVLEVNKQVSLFTCHSSLL